MILNASIRRIRQAGDAMSTPTSRNHSMRSRSKRDIRKLTAHDAIELAIDALMAGSFGQVHTHKSIKAAVRILTVIDAEAVRKGSAS